MRNLTLNGVIASLRETPELGTAIRPFPAGVAERARAIYAAAGRKWQVLQHGQLMLAIAESVLPDSQARPLAAELLRWGNISQVSQELAGKRNVGASTLDSAAEAAFVAALNAASGKAGAK